MNEEYEDDFDATYSPGKQFSMISRTRRPKKRGRSRPLTLAGELKRKQQFKCHICGLECAEKNCLKSHLTYTHSELAYQCPCGRAFSRPSNMRKHVANSHPELDPTDRSLMQVVKRSELSDTQQAVMKKLSIISRKRKIFQEPKLILPTITAFNCYDCDGVFKTITQLFDHCKHAHRLSEDGYRYPYLIPVSTAQWSSG